MNRFIVVLIALFVSGALLSQEKNTKCKDELARICPGYGGDGNKLGACLKDPEKSKQLSPECKPRRVDFPAIKASCNTEIKSYCAAATEDGKLYMCIRQQMNKNPSSVGQNCKDQMNK